MAGFVFPFYPAREIVEEPMEPREKPDSYGEWAIRRVQQEAEEDGSGLPAEVITSARMVWPRVAVPATQTFVNSRLPIEAKTRAQPEVTDTLDAYRA